MKVLDSKTLLDLMQSKNPDQQKIPEEYDDLELESFTHIASDHRTLSALAKYTESAARNPRCILDLSSLEEICPAVLLVFLRASEIDYIHFNSLKHLDLPCSKILVAAINRGTSWISFGMGFDIAKLAPEVLAEIFATTRYGWCEKGHFQLFGESVFKEWEDAGHLV